MYCNHCESEDFELLFENYKRKSSRHNSYPTKVYICRACGLVCLDLSKVNQQSLIEYYSIHNTFAKPELLPESHKHMRKKQSEWAILNLPENHNVQSILDVGCGSGYNLKVFKDHGFECYGNDLSPIMIKYLKQLYKINGYEGSFSNKLVKRKFDMISCICALEHFLDPSTVMQNFHSSLNENGFLFLELPDSEYPMWDIISDHVAFDHLFHWNIRTGRQLMEKHGFEVLKIERIKNSINSGNPEPTFRILGKKINHFSNDYKIKNDYRKMKNALIIYKKKHNIFLSTFQNKIDEIAKKIGGEPLAIFCGGEHTSTLLDRFNFSKLHIKIIFDNDPSISNSKLLGIPIKHGTEVIKYSINHFLISSTNHEKVIYDSLKKINSKYNVYCFYSNIN